MRREAGLSGPAALEGPALADWAEAIVLIEERRAISRADLRRRGQSADASDVELDLLMREVQSRAAWAPTIYPFRTDGSRIHLMPNIESVWYEYLLLAALPEAPFRASKRFARVEYPLDALTTEALMALLGPSAESIQFAWPSSPDRPSRFPDALRWLADRLDLPAGSGFRPPRKKDGGVDVVAWRKFRDDRNAYAIVLAQTTLQMSFATKARDIVPNQWNAWIAFGVEPLRALVVPHAITAGDTAWDDAHYSVHLIIDRFRLCELLDGRDLTHLALKDGSPLAEHVTAWVQNQYDALLV
jgi:hypothetical protein